MPRYIDKDEALKNVAWDTEAYQSINMIPTDDVVEVVLCKDCKHRIVNENYGKRGHLKEIKAVCELDTGDPYELGRNAENDNWFCADGERRTI